MSIEHCFDQGSVICNLHSSDKYEALRELIRRAPIFRDVEEPAALEEAVIARERVQSTGFGHGVAVAHGRTTGVGRVLIGLGVSREGIAFDSPDGEPVRLLFVIASPVQVSLDYLQALSTVVRCVRDKGVRDSLLQAAEEREIEKRIREAFVNGLQRCAEMVGDPRSCGASD
jgi:PTS system nitrogen regulatory IIA component